MNISRIPPLKEIFLFFILISVCIQGQGILKGIVLDSLTADQLKGAEIVLKGTTFRTVTNVNGEFYISEIPTGEYILHASYWGYKEKEYLVTINSGEILELDIELLPSITTINAMTLTDQAKDQAEVINLQVQSNSIKNVISGGKLQRMPDENILIALSRLPGVSIKYHMFPPSFMSNGGRATGNENDIIILFPPLDDFSMVDDKSSRVTIRGLDSKYSNITINGTRLPTNSAKERFVDLILIPQRSFENIELSKTITSDEEADATAGTIKMVIGKAPSKRIIKADFLGNYNKLDKYASQYNFNGTYAERFFDNSLGLKVNANLEKNDLSNEYISSVNSWKTPKYSYLDSKRNRLSTSILLDLNTSDGGSIKFNNFFDKANTDNFEYRLDSTVYRDPRSIFSEKKIEQELFLSSITGSNHLLGFDVDWGMAFTESKNDHPFYYSLNFTNLFSTVKNEYHLDYATDSPTKNYFKEKTISLDISKKYNINNEITGKLKFGGKYRSNSILYDEDLRIENSNLTGDGQYRKLADGTMVIKDFTGTRFDGLVGESKKNILLSYFQGKPPGERLLFDKYAIPLINMEALRLWRNLTFNEYYSDDGPDINSYNISGDVLAGYIMHNLSFGRLAQFIAGLRMESEQNQLSGYYFSDRVKKATELYNDIPIRTDTYNDNKISILPNFQMILEPTNYLNLRLAAYKTLIRPDYYARLPKIFYTSNYLNMGNPNLKNADVWSYEFQTQYHGDIIGLFSITTFYKDIKGMQQATNGIITSGNEIIEKLGINFSSYPINFPYNENSAYSLYTYFNSTKPTLIWGFEIEHKTNFRYLPGLLKNITLDYNLTFLRSETSVIDIIPVYGEVTEYKLTNHKEKLRNVPKLFANVVLGYDIKGFSVQISYFYQDVFKMENNNIETKQNRFSRLDVIVRQQILENISAIFILNNINSPKEEYSYENAYSYGHKVSTAQAYRYGFNFSFGIGINL